MPKYSEPFHHDSLDFGAAAVVGKIVPLPVDPLEAGAPYAVAAQIISVAADRAPAVQHLPFRLAGGVLAVGEVVEIARDLLPAGRHLPLFGIRVAVAAGVHEIIFLAADGLEAGDGFPFGVVIIPDAFDFLPAGGGGGGGCCRGCCCGGRRRGGRLGGSFRGHCSRRIGGRLGGSFCGHCSRGIGGRLGGSFRGELRLCCKQKTEEQGECCRAV